MLSCEIERFYAWNVNMTPRLTTKFIMSIKKYIET